jgi:hypothetical protein
MFKLNLICFVIKANLKMTFDSLATQLLKSLEIAHKLDPNEELVREKRSTHYMQQKSDSFFDEVFIQSIY